MIATESITSCSTPRAALRRVALLPWSASGSEGPTPEGGSGVPAEGLLPVKELPTAGAPPVGRALADVPLTAGHPPKPPSPGHGGSKAPSQRASNQGNPAFRHQPDHHAAGQTRPGRARHLATAADTPAPPLTRPISQPSHIPGEQLACAGRRDSTGTGACRKRPALPATPSGTEGNPARPAGVRARSTSCGGAASRRSPRLGRACLAAWSSAPGPPQPVNSRPPDPRWYPSAGRGRSRGTRGPAMPCTRPWDSPRHS